MKKTIMAAGLSMALCLGHSVSNGAVVAGADETTSTTNNQQAWVTEDPDAGLLSLSNYLKLKGLWEKPLVRLLASIVVMVSAIMTAINAGIYGARFFHIYIPGISE